MSEPTVMNSQKFYSSCRFDAPHPPQDLQPVSFPPQTSFLPGYIPTPPPLPFLPVLLLLVLLTEVWDNARPAKPKPI